MLCGVSKHPRAMSEDGSRHETSRLGCRRELGFLLYCLISAVITGYELFSQVLKCDACDQISPTSLISSRQIFASRLLACLLSNMQCAINNIHERDAPQISAVHNPTRHSLSFRSSHLTLPTYAILHIPGGTCTVDPTRHQFDHFLYSTSIQSWVGKTILEAPHATIYCHGSSWS